MSRDAVEATVKVAAESLSRLGMRGAEDFARGQVSRIAEVSDRKARHAPEPIRLDPHQDFTRPEMGGKRIKVRIPASDRGNWELERANGRATPRVGSSGGRTRVSHDPIQRAAREMLERHG